MSIKAALAASAALSVSNINFAGPISEVRVARIDGNFVVNPNRSDLDKAGSLYNQALAVRETEAYPQDQLERIAAMKAEAGNGQSMNEPQVKCSLRSATRVVSKRPLSKKMVNLLVHPDAETRKEVLKMQNMVEETLTKNMHLQKDLENLSQEVVRLSKLAAERT